MRETRDGVVVLRAEGDIDLATVGRLEHALSQARHEGTRIVVDLAGCPFIDSSGLRALVDAQNATRQTGASLALVTADPNVRRVFEVSALDRVFEIHPTVDAALDR